MCCARSFPRKPPASGNRFRSGSLSLPSAPSAVGAVARLGKRHGLHVGFSSQDGQYVVVTRERCMGTCTCRWKLPLSHRCVCRVFCSFLVESLDSNLQR